jgi:hypothetical protein
MNTLDVVQREEFEAVREMAAKAREENKALAARIEALEAKLAELAAKTPTRPHRRRPSLVQKIIVNFSTKPDPEKCFAVNRLTALMNLCDSAFHMRMTQCEKLGCSRDSRSID